MRAYVKKGYTHSGIVDLRIAKQRKPIYRAGVIRKLEAAAEYRLSVLGCEIRNGLIVKRDRFGTPVITDMTPESAKYLARQYIDRAREWRLEFAA